MTAQAIYAILYSGKSDLFIQIKLTRQALMSCCYRMSLEHPTEKMIKWNSCKTVIRETGLPENFCFNPRLVNPSWTYLAQHDNLDSCYVMKWPASALQQWNKRTNRYVYLRRLVQRQTSYRLPCSWYSPCRSSRSQCHKRNLPHPQSERSPLMSAVYHFRGQRFQGTRLLKIHDAINS